MKKILSLLSLAALTVGLLGSCSKIDERISNLEKRIDGIESTSIASVQQQIDGIKASITKLEAADVTVNGKIDELKATAEAHQTLIDALKEADKALGQKDTELEARIATLEGQVATINGQIKTLEEAGKAINDRIDELKTYVDTEIGKTKDWAKETFATLEQYQKTADDLAALSVTVTGISTTLAEVQTSIAGLDTKINGIDADLQGKITAAKTELEGKITSLKTELEDKIATAITASETSIKSWINELLEGYYTIAQVDAKIGSLNTAIEGAKGTAKTRIDSVATELTELKKVVDTEKATIRTEYKEAIKVAIDSLDGEIRGALLDSIAAVNGRIEALDTRVTTLEGKVLALEGNVNKLLAMIQSVTILPAYTDGSVEAVNGMLTIDFVVSPAAAVKGVTKDSIKVLVHQAKVQTKANESYTKIDVKSANVNEATGDVTITANISKITPAEGKALTVAVNIKNGISDFTTEFVPVTLPVSVSLDKHSIVVPSPSSDKDTTLIATVKPSTKDVAWTSSNTNIATVDGSGKVTIKAGVCGKDTIVVKTVEGNATDTCFITVLPKGALAGEFSVSADKKVYFSQGNLQATYNSSTSTYTWGFAANQYDYIGDAAGNTTIDSQQNGSVVDLFGWSTSTNGGTSTTDKYGIMASETSSDYYGDFYDWGKAVGDGNTWRTLSKDEWTYLFNTRTMTNGKDRYSNAMSGVTIGGSTYKGIFLYPDNYNGDVVSSSMTWNDINAAGIVFLPAAGSRFGSDVSYVGDRGRYWSSSANDSDFAYLVLFVSDGVSPDDCGFRFRGCSVRLVSDLKSSSEYGYPTETEEENDN